jgi:hypothetical protein
MEETQSAMKLGSIERIERFLNLTACSLIGGGGCGVESPAIDIASFVDVSGFCQQSA